MVYARVCILAAMAVAFDARVVVTQTRDTQATSSGVIAGLFIAGDYPMRTAGGRDVKCGNRSRSHRV